MTIKYGLCLASIMALVLTMACSSPVPTAAPTKPVAAAISTPAAAKPVASGTIAPAAATKPTAGTPAPAANIKRGGIFVSGRTGSADSLDPIYEITGTYMKEIGVYEALVRFEVDDYKNPQPKMVGELAESWQREDPKTLTFKLRKGIKFHDGSEFNAEVAKWSLERMGSAPKSRSKMLAKNFDKLEVVDPQILRIHYKTADALQLMDLTLESGGTGSIGPAIVSKAAIEKMGEEAFGEKPSATGPLQVSEWKRDQEIVMKKFDGYWRMGADGKPLPYIEGARSRIIPTTAPHIPELKSGALHLSRAFVASDIPTLGNDPNLVIVNTSWAPRPHFFGFNDQKEPFGKNLKLRQAAHYATDQIALAKVMGLDYGSPNNYLGWTPTWPGYDKSLPYYEFNLDKAIQLVKEAGFPNGVDIEAIIASGGAGQKRAELTQAMWAKAGIRMKISAADNIAARAKIKAGDFEMHLWDMVPSPDPAYFERMFTCEGAANWSNYCNKETDKCMFEARVELDANKRADLYKKCQKLMYEDAQLGGLFQADNIIVMRKEVKGLKLQYTTEELREIWLDK